MTMKAHTLIAALALTVAGSAFAGPNDSEAYVSFPIPQTFAKSFTGNKTVAEVRAEQAKARTDGQAVGGENYVAAPAKADEKTEHKVETVNAAK
jgi:lipopolysaccharide export system protein LptC